MSYIWFVKLQRKCPQYSLLCRYVEYIQLVDTLHRHDKRGFRCVEIEPTVYTVRDQVKHTRNCGHVYITTWCWWVFGRIFLSEN